MIKVHSHRHNLSDVVQGQQVNFHLKNEPEFELCFTGDIGQEYCLLIKNGVCVDIMADGEPCNENLKQVNQILRKA